MRLADAIDQFVLQLEADGRSPHTTSNYARHLGLLGRWLGPNDDLDAITPQVLARFLVADTTRTGRSASTMNAIRTSLRVVFAWLHQAGLIPSNPARMIRRAICSPPPPKGMSASEIERLLATVATGSTPEAKRDYVLFGLMAATGVRLSSAISIMIEDVDLDRAEILLRHTKRDRSERVLLNATTVTLLGEYVGVRRSGVLFEAMHGGVLGRRQAARRLEGWLERAGLCHRGAHAFRHGFGLALYQRTGDILVVQRALGHRSIASTLSYARATEERVRAALG
ncbi:MAG: tyrosine-type recombinase/integrase [Planctomycetes bacterium]|nr:tyrosine-type recombinase/integrase [Planctomycetota bacterium]